LVIRHADAARDGAACAAIYAPFVTDSYVSFEERAPDGEEFARRIERISYSYPWLVAEEDGAVIGFAYAAAHRERAAYRWAADVAVYVDERARRRGIGRALYEALLALLAQQGVRTVCAGVALPNDASVRLHEAVGFRPVGVYRRIGYKQGAWWDVGWWQLQLRDDDGAPPELAPPARLDQRWSSSSTSASVGHASTARSARPSSSGGTSSSSRIG
jgi:phosphinothricin acetyltransferase